MMEPANIFYLPYWHGQPGPPVASSFGGGGSGDRSDPGIAFCVPRGPFPDGLRGRGGPDLG